MKNLIICFYFLFKSKKNFDVEAITEFNNHKKFFMIRFTIDYSQNNERMKNSRDFRIQYNSFLRKLKYIVEEE